MLNDSSSQRQPPPRLHTTQSFDRTPASTPSLESYPDRSQSHPPPLSASEYRSPANGSYFAVQSPHQQNSPPAVTPGVTGSLLYAQSPGPHGQLQTPREAIPPVHSYQSSFVPPPSAPQPPTPGSAHHYQAPSSALTYHPPGTHSALTTQSPREDASSSNGSAPPGSRHLSPQAPFHPPPAPATPLGPPVSYPRPSPYQHRPLSQGQESLRRLSASSVGSTQSREYNQQGHGPLGHSRSGSIQRTYSGEMRERERSIESVSPKTIPKPSPQRRTSLSQSEEIRADPAQVPSDHDSTVLPYGPHDHIGEDRHHDTTPKAASILAEAKATPSHPTSRPSPGIASGENMTPGSAPSPFPAQPSSPTAVQPTLKRTASRLSSANGTPQPPRKRLRRDEVPIFARSARTRPLKFIKAPPVTAAARSQPPARKEGVGQPIVNGQPHAQAHVQGQGVATGPAPGSAPSQVQAVVPGVVPAAAAQDELPWEPSITNVVPYEDLSRRVCDWVVQMIGMANPPGGGAMFEIEAKIGSIVDEQTGHRLSLPVETEALFNRDKFRGRTSFQSSMDMVRPPLSFYSTQC